MARGAAWTLEIHRILAEEGPQSWENLMSRAGALVPPGQAYREHVRHRELSAGYQGYSKPEKPKPGDAEAVRSGRRQIVGKALHQERRRGLLTYNSDTPTAERLVASICCPTCGRPY